MPNNQTHQLESSYTLEIVAQLTQIRPQALRQYDRRGIVKAQRQGRTLLYTDAEVMQLRKVQRLVRDCGLNLAGVEVVLRLTQQIETLQARLAGETPVDWPVDY